MRVRARYAKTGKLRFISAIDLGRVWERALRKADLPIAYSEGFSPHPKVSFAEALPLGYASIGEYAELTFATAVPVEVSMAALNEAFPHGLRVLSAQEAPEGAAKLAKRLQASCWELEYPAEVAAEVLARAVEVTLAAGELLVARERKGETTTVDLRPTLHALAADGSVVRAVLHHVEPQVRPSELHDALRLAAGAVRPLVEPVLVTRIAQGLPAPGGLEEALDEDLVLVTRDDTGTTPVSVDPALQKAIS